MCNQHDDAGVINIEDDLILVENMNGNIYIQNKHCTESDDNMLAVIMELVLAMYTTIIANSNMMLDNNY